MCIAVCIEAPVDRVWRALTVPEEVSRWDGVEPADVPPGYPRPGQHARWLTRLGPIRVVLHDRLQVVDPPFRLTSVIDVGFVHLSEDYLLTEIPTGTALVSHNAVSSSVPGLGGLAAWLTRRNVGASLDRLVTYCRR